MLLLKVMGVGVLTESVDLLVVVVSGFVEHTTTGRYSGTGASASGDGSIDTTGSVIGRCIGIDSANVGGSICC